MIRIAFALIAVVALTGGVAAAKPATATPAPAPAGTEATLGVWTVHMTEVDYNNQSSGFSTPQHVLMTRNGGDINADRASGNANAKVVTLYGHVVVHDVQGAFNSSAGSVAKNKGPATLTCDQLRVDSKAKVYVATGHVHYTQDRTIADADAGTLDDAAHTMDLTGNVKIVDGLQSLSGADRVHYNTVTGQMHAESDHPGAVILQFPGGNGPVIATPRPIRIRNPLGKKAPQPTPSP
ncbi:MAG TPA: LptA/OstA family protein [Verrucomicrobiae bacterium]|jgi:lipopolysaccharide export system protein LptA|nr:LptA/OstA family protein [Verrucomicrobiae bacterium]